MDDDAARDGAVVAVGATCDLGRQTPRGDVSLRLSEYVRLASGERVVLHRDRGVTVGTPGGGSTDLTEREVRELALGALLPDEGDEPGETHPWRWLAELAADRGVTVTPEELKRLPYELELEPAVRALVGRA